jgi:hypothetical protein
MISLSRVCITQIYISTKRFNSFRRLVDSGKLEVTIARKMLPHPQGMKGSMRNLLNKGMFILSHQDEI